MVDITIVNGGYFMVYKPTFTSLGPPSEVLEIAPTELSDDLQWAADGAWVMRRGRKWLFFSGIFVGFSWDFIDFNGFSCGVRGILRRV